MLSFLEFLIEEDKWSYTHSGFIDPKGKVHNGGHNVLSAKLKINRLGDKHHAKFLITTGGEAHYKFDHQTEPHMVHHVMKHAKENEHHIKRLHLHSNHHGIDTIAQKYNDIGSHKKIEHIHSEIKHWLNN